MPSTWEIRYLDSSVKIYRSSFLIRLDNPGFYKNNEEVKKMFLRELEVNYNVTDVAQQAQIFKLVENEEYMLTFSVLSLAKNHNFFASLDNYMKEFSRICLRFMPEHISKRLEEVLNREILIVANQEQASVVDSYITPKLSKDVEIHHNVLAQPQF